MFRLSDILCFVLQEDAEDQTAADLAVVLFETATLRSGYQLADTKAYGDRIERMLRLSMNVDINEQVCAPSSIANTKWRRSRSYEAWLNILLLCPQVEEEPEEEPEEQTEEAEDEEEVQADEDAEEESVSVENFANLPSCCSKSILDS